MSLQGFSFSSELDLKLTCHLQKQVQCNTFSTSTVIWWWAAQFVWTSWRCGPLQRGSKFLLLGPRNLNLSECDSLQHASWRQTARKSSSYGWFKRAFTLKEASLKRCARKTHSKCNVFWKLEVPNAIQMVKAVL